MEKSLKDLISRLPIPGLKESADRHTIAEKITNVIGIPVKPNQITLKEGVVTIAIPPIVKSALQIKQKELIDIFAKEGITVYKLR